MLKRLRTYNLYQKVLSSLLVGLGPVAHTLPGFQAVFRSAWSKHHASELNTRTEETSSPCQKCMFPRVTFVFDQFYCWSSRPAMPWTWPGVSCLRSLSPVEGAPNSTSSPYTLFLCVSLHFCPLDKWLLLSHPPSNDWALQTFSSRVPLILIRYDDPNLCNICQCFKWWFYSLTGS